MGSALSASAGTYSRHDRLEQSCGDKVAKTERKNEILQVSRGGRWAQTKWGETTSGNQLSVSVGWMGRFRQNQTLGHKSATTHACCTTENLLATL